MVEKLVKKNNITVQGTASKVMLFVHGYGCDQNIWRFITPHFKDTYKIVLIDLVGSGKSDESAYDYDKYNSLEGHADDIINICDALNLKDVFIVAHSVSAMIATCSCKKTSALQKNNYDWAISPIY